METKADLRFAVKDFEGPLDVLLFLIQKNAINVYDIPVAQITEQYLRILRGLEELNLEELTDFHAMAGTLLYLKSRMLLPGDFSWEEEDSDPRRDLAARLIEYQRFKKLSVLMAAQEGAGEWFIDRKKTQRLLPFTEEPPEPPDVRDLLKTFAGLMATLPEERIIDLYEEVSVNEKITLLAEYLEARGECSFSDLLLRAGSRNEVICAFLAVLEAGKLRRVRISQDRLFGEIRLRAPEELGHG